MATSAYKKGLRRLLAGEIPFASADIGIMLLDPTYTFDADHEYVSDIVDKEVENDNGDGYFRKILENRIVEENGSNIAFLSSPARWNFIDTTTNVGSAVVYAISFNEENSVLISHHELPETETVGSDLLVEFDNDEILRVET